MFRRFGVSYLILLPLLLLAAQPASAQQQTGSIIIKVTDPQGAVMPGVTIALTSPVLPGERTGVTDSDGVYRFVSLTIGTYQAKCTLQGFQPLVRSNITVVQTQTVSVDVQMKIGSMSEVVQVSGESPVVDTKTVGSITNISQELLQTTPGGKDIWSILEYKAAGVTIDGGNPPDVGGNQGGLQRSLSARGTPNAQNTQMLNGVNVNDPSAQGFSMNYYIPSAFQNVEVSTSAQDIAVGTGGVFINMVSKSGSNLFSGLGLQTYQSSHIGAQNVNTAQQNLGLAPAGNVTNLLTNTNGQAGGPIMKNKLFFFGSANFQATHVSVLGFPAVPPSYVPTQLANFSQQDTTDIIAGEGKITYAAKNNHRFEGYFSKQRYDKPNRGLASNNTQDSNFKELDTFLVEQLAWNWVMNQSMILDSKLSYNNTHFPLYEKTNLQPLTDNTTGNVYRNNTQQQINFRRRLEGTSNWQYFRPDLLGGRHEFKAGFDNGYTPATFDQTRAGNVNDFFTSSNGQAATVTLFNTPIQTKTAVMSTAFYGQDSVTYWKLSVTGGIRWERVEGYLPAQHMPASTYFPAGTTFTNVTISGTTYPTFVVKQDFDEVHNDPLYKNWAPRVAATYDLTGDGKTALKFSVGKYLDQINTGTPPNPAGNINQSYVWNDVNGDLVFDPGTLVWNSATNTYTGGELGAFRNQTIPNPAGIFVQLKRPYRNELSVSVDREVIPNLLVTVGYFHTREHNNQGNVDGAMANWGNMYTQVPINDPGRDGVLGTSDDQTINVYSLNAGQTTSVTAVNDDRLAVHYNGFELSANKRYSNGWTFIASYDYSHTKQDLTGLSNPNQVFVNANGESGGRRHIVKFSGSKQLPWELLVAANISLQSGLPITRTYGVPTCTATVTTSCTNQGLTINAEPRGSVELPWLNRLDLRVGRGFNLAPRKRIDASIDLFNAFNSNTVWQTRTNTGTTNVRVGGVSSGALVTIPSFLSPTGVLSPRVLQFNVTYSF